MRRGSILALLCAISLATPVSTVLARKKIPDQHLNRANFVQLPANKSATEFVISYPGTRVSNICAIHLRISAHTPSNRKTTIALSAAIEVRDSTGRKLLQPATKGTLLYVLASQGTYITSIRIRTLDGKTFGEVGGRILGGTAGFAVTAVGCNKQTIRKGSHFRRPTRKK